MDGLKLKYKHLTDEVVNDIVDGDAVLWIGESFDSAAQDLNALINLIYAPWRMVFCESTKSEVFKSLERDQSPSDRFSHKRGFIHVVATDPEHLELPRKAMPVFMLNGRDNALDSEESSSLKGNAALRRRLNMLNLLNMDRPKRLVLLSNGEKTPLDDVFSLWEEGFRSLLTVVSESDEDMKRIDEWLALGVNVNAVSFITLDLRTFTEDLLSRLLIQIPEEKIVIRARNIEVGVFDIDITDCELVEQPILDRYEIIQTQHLRKKTADDLSEEEVKCFFDKSKKDWTPFAAGLPWDRNSNARSEVLKELRKLEMEGSDENKIFYISSESGAGGTTFARFLSFCTAQEGFPTLVAKQISFRPESTEINSFLYRIRQKAMKHYALKRGELQVSDEKKPFAEIPFFIVFDVQHWEGHEEELRHFLNDITSGGRPVLILLVTSQRISDELKNSSRSKLIETLSHELSQEEVLSLGRHLNRFLKIHNMEKSDTDWIRFWEDHTPGIRTQLSSFWIALEFWLKGIFDFSQSIQSWIFEHFKNADITDDFRILLLEIAAMTTERRPLPEGLMPISKSTDFPYSVLLEDFRSEVPALALVRESFETHRHWAMTHDLLGRYLITSTFYDREMLERLNLSNANDPIHLRILLLRRIATRTAVAEKHYFHIAIDFAIKIFKLDPEGNPEFFRYWKEVLAILENMPTGIRKTSRTFNHHVAISRRRVAVNPQYFEATVEEKKNQLEKAISEIEFAINFLERRRGDDESNLNLYNSLSLAYQNLTNIEIEMGGSEEHINELRNKANRAALSALKEDPTNSYVLETVARDLIQDANFYKKDVITSASEALSYIFQAVSLDRSEYRQTQLTRLANEALTLLRKEGSSEEIERLCSRNEPYGYLAKIWLTLADSLDEFESYQLNDLPKKNIESALRIINEYCTDEHNWLLLRFRYDLVTIAEPKNFEEQLKILDELEGLGGYRMPLQLQLEHAILLYQGNRPYEANRKFYRLRQDLKQYDVIVTVPIRLRWLLTDDRKSRRICDAIVAGDIGFQVWSRSWAKVRDLQNAIVPFIPQEFNYKSMPPNLRFKCHITFSRMGPFIKPPESEE
jgi:hypothetical protein